VTDHPRPDRRGPQNAPTSLDPGPRLGYRGPFGGSRAVSAAPARPPGSPPRRTPRPQGGSVFDRRRGVSFRPALTCGSARRYAIRSRPSARRIRGHEEPRHEAEGPSSVGGGLTVPESRRSAERLYAVRPAQRRVVALCGRSAWEPPERCRRRSCGLREPPSARAEHASDLRADPSTHLASTLRGRTRGVVVAAKGLIRAASK
jgi:hypothetical protein